MTRAAILATVFWLICLPIGAGKTVNLPAQDITDVIRIAGEHLKTRQIDLTHRFLIAVEYKNVESEYDRPFWLLTWSSGGSVGAVYMRVYNSGEVEMFCADRHLCPAGI